MATKLESLSSIFEEILGKDVYQDLIDNPSPKGYLAVGEKIHAGLSDDHLQSLDKLQFTDEQRDVYTRAVLDAMANISDDVVEEAKREVTTAWSDFTNALHNAERHFQLEGKPAERQKMWTMIWLSFPLILLSRFKASEIMDQADDFDLRIIPLCADTKVPLEERLEIIRALTKVAEDNETASENLARNFESWNKQYQNVLLGPALASTTPTSNLQKTVSNLTPELSFASGPISIATASSGSSSAFLKISGLLSVGTPEAKIASLLISAAVHSSPPSIDSHYDVGDMVRRMEDSTSNFRKYWRFNASDFKAIVRWLEQGAEYAELPSYMRQNLEEGQKVYVEMARRLRGYAAALHAKVDEDTMRFKYTSPVDIPEGSK